MAPTTVLIYWHDTISSLFQHEPPKATAGQIPVGYAHASK